MAEQRQKGRHFGVRESLGKRKQLCFQNLGFGPQAMAAGGEGAAEGGKEFREDGNVLKRHLTFTAFY